MRDPLTIIEPNLEGSIEIPLSATGVSAGFPSPIEGQPELSLDLNKELIRNPASTFFARVSGVSMQDEGVCDGDLLVIDKSISPYEGCLAVCFIDGDFTLKRVHFDKDCGWLVPSNKDYKPIRVTSDNHFIIWGIVRYLIKKV